MVNKKITIKDIAHEAGVSITTVSRFLNGNFSSMGLETKNRIQSVIERLNFRPNKLAQGLKGQSRTIAVVVVNIGYPFCVSVIRSISDVLNATGYSLVVCESGGDTAKELLLLQSLVAQGVDGLIIQTNGNNNEFLAQVAETMPVVFIDRGFSVSGTENVVTDNSAASCLLVEGLFREGYEQVLYVSETIGQISTRRERYDGYLKACSTWGRTPCQYWVDKENPDSFLALVESVSVLDDKPRALYTANGLIMLELYPLLMELGRSVPSELGLATFDEPDWVRITAPMLTCVRQPTEEMGRLSANLVLRRFTPSTVTSEASHHVIPSLVAWAGSTQRSSNVSPNKV